jgi:hypothetical protein
VARHGWDAFRITTVVDGLAVGKWVQFIRHTYLKGRLNANLALELKAITNFPATLPPVEPEMAGQVFNDP